MVEVSLERFAYSPLGTFGRLWVKGRMWFTVELPWHYNRVGDSCVPVGVYKMVWEYSPRFDQYLWELKDVPGRSEIKIHNANFASQLNGCIAPGKALGALRGTWAVLRSVEALDEFHAELEAQVPPVPSLPRETSITIENYMGGHVL